MLTPQLSASYRPLPLYPSKSTLRVLRRAPQLSALVLIGADSFPAHQARNLAALQRQGCFFGPRRVWSSYPDPDFQRRLEKRRKSLHYRYVQSLHRKSLWDREPSRPSWAWKLSSSWGVHSRWDSQVGYHPGGRCVSSGGGASKNAKGDPEGRRDGETRRERMERRMEEIRRTVDRDPFKALFGYRMRILSRPSSNGDLGSLLDWGRKSCAGMISRLNAYDQKGRNGVEDRTTPLGNMPDAEGKGQAEKVSEDPAQREPSKYSPQATAADEFEFDPITMRRVPKQAKVDLDAADSAPRSHYQSVSNLERSQSLISSSATAQGDPVGTGPSKHTPVSTDQAHGLKNLATPTEQSQHSIDTKPSRWLEQEGFVGGSKNSRDRPESSPPVDAGASPPAPTKILRVREFEIPPEPPSEDRPATAKHSRLCYDTSESRVEDLDLLRPSDVRASAGILKNRDAEGKLEKQQRRERLEDEFRRATRSGACSEEVKAMKVLQQGGGASEPPEALPEKDGFVAAPQVQETAYDQTPQSLETCYDQEVKIQRALLHEAEVGGCDKTPQAPGALRAQGAETQKQVNSETDAHDGESQRLQTSLDRKIKAQEASPETIIYGYDTKAMGSETYAQETESQKTQRQVSEQQKPWNEPSEEGQQRMLFSESNKIPTRQSDAVEPFAARPNSEAQGENDGFTPPRVANDQAQVVGTEDGVQREQLVWENRSPKWAARKSKKQRDRDLVKEIRGIYEDAYGVIDTDHRMQPLQTEGSDGESPVILLDDALIEHDKRLGINAYKHEGDDGSEAEILAKSQPRLPHESKVTEHQSSEELAMRREEQEQILHEEVNEVNDLLHDVQSELDAIKAKSSTHTGSHQVVYKILAYDPATNELTSGITTSSTDSEILSPSEIIPRLSHPAKFLPSLTALKKEGYEIVSGGKNVLVFKRVHEGPFIEEEDPIPDEYPHLSSSSLYPYVNPIDGTTTTGNFASPTGFVNHDAIFSSPFSDTDIRPLDEPPPPSPSPSPSPSPATTPLSSPSPTDKVKREEAVFSGKSKWQDAAPSASQDQGPKTERVKKAAKRIFWVGLWVAGCSYAVGVMGEFFRTGGADGAGPQWFSGFH
ncbi:hypothetical protein FGG08_006967 [Glutinoglossum americanum]|uniref:Uncharacterized protein n=1 Tax=Glutinoglossum americanum TaxID=1670608 RepID=A0A9P8I0E3_9PEZI|nr:hypothetical protein FGG08_006967 [Glutinoglossum americanum]